MSTGSVKDLIELEIQKENQRQVAKWGIQNHNPFIYQNILMEEVGEVSKAILDDFDWIEEKFSNNGLMELRYELVQVAAVAKAFIESIDRNKTTLTKTPTEV